MAEFPKYTLSFDLNVLNHLGIGLYSNIPAVLSEMVSNAWDAAATHVDINIYQDMIEIIDNGIGMSLEEINQRYLRVGYQKRKQENTVIVNGEARHVMGRKGIGKLSVFSIANVVEIRTCKDNVYNGFRMDFSEIEGAIDRGSFRYDPTPLEDIAIQAHGTRLTLKELRQNIYGMDVELRTDLARRFSIIDDDRPFNVFVNGERISLKDRNYYDKVQFIWYFGSESQKYVARCTNARVAKIVDNLIDSIDGYRITGWIATITKPKDVEDQQHTISIFANGKLIQENILPEVPDARLFMTYVIGEIDADFLDADEAADIVTSDRQRINQNDPRYQILRNFIIREVKKIGNEWDDLRGKLTKKDRKKKLSQNGLGDNSEQPALPDGSAESSALGIGVSRTQPGTDSGGGSPEAETPDGVTSPPIPGNTNSSADQVPYASGTPPLNIPRAPSREAETLFNEIRSSISSSLVEDAFKEIAYYDLEQARLSYYNQAYKACVVMLCSVLEGMMIATLRKPELLDLMYNDPDLPKTITNQLHGLPSRNPKFVDRAVFGDAIGELGLEGYRILIQHYIPAIETLGVAEPIQHFRNAVHAWVSYKHKDLYRRFDFARALSYLASLKTLLDNIFAWNPSTP